MPQTDAKINIMDLQDFREPFLLHACCGPCLEWPARQYLLEGRSFTAWFYNPNIHPPVEHERRRIAFLHLAARLGICHIYTTPRPRDRQTTRIPSSA